MNIQRNATGKLKEILDNIDEESLAETRQSMLTIEERAKEHFAHNWHGSVIDAYTEGAKDQQKIDIKKACEAVCSFCQDKEKCDAESYDAIEHIRLAVSCEKIDEITEAMEGYRI